MNPHQDLVSARSFHIHDQAGQIDGRERNSDLRLHRVRKHPVPESREAHGAQGFQGREGRLRAPPLKIDRLPHDHQGPVALVVEGAQSVERGRAHGQEKQRQTRGRSEKGPPGRA